MSAVLADDGANRLTLDVAGDENVLVITQTSGPLTGGQGAPNRMDISITGDKNGGAMQDWMPGIPTNAQLMPGQLMQAGFGNRLALKVSGRNNLFAVAQEGEGNRVTGQMLGQANQTMVMQTGMHNLAVFSQSGQGNTIMVSQSSW